MLNSFNKSGVKITKQIKIDSNLQTTQKSEEVVFDGVIFIEFNEGNSQIFTQTGSHLQRELLIYLPLNTLNIADMLDYTVFINPNNLFENTAFNPSLVVKEYKISRIERVNGFRLAHDYVICNV